MTPRFRFAPCILIVSAAIASAQTPTPPPATNAGGRGGAAASATLATQMLAQGDKNADQSLTQEEFAALADAWFARLDPDRIGRVPQEEFLQRFDAVATPPTAAVGAGAGGGRRGGRGGATGGSALAVFTILDLNRDAVLTQAEMKQTFAKWFETWDSDKNTRLDRTEIAKGLESALPRTNMGASAQESQGPVAGLPTPPPSPVLNPKESMSTIRIVDGFKIELAATEPMVVDPVAMSFDEDGRAYVVEMRGYMIDIDRAQEREPISRITRLEDTNGDGIFDKVTVFVDGLILPRAVAAIGNGILYVSDYKLYYARDTDGDGKADRTELVDADYGRGNVEHAANALFRAMDNWIYNGESPNRYRLVTGTLVKQATEVRGQWGMTQDNYGRLLYNVNNSQLLGDYTPPNYMGRNSHHPATAGLNLFVANDQRVFPIRMTTAVNRGYSEGVLDPTGKSYVFASSCSPLVYRGDNFPAEFVGNAFVCDPALNLIKRNLVSAQNLTLTSTFAYPDREFLASTDERFRPVNLYNGPDGALWMLDLYRGIAQYGQFMTAYLRRETLARNLDKGIHQGRIYRIASAKKAPAPFPHLSGESSASLVAHLSDANGWTRDTAQRLLVERGDRSIAPALTQLVSNGAAPLGRVHALWTLEGLFADVPEKSPAPAPAASASLIRLLAADAEFRLEANALPPAVLNACLKAIGDPDSGVQSAAIRVTELLTAGNSARQLALEQALGKMNSATPAEVVFQAALSAGNLPKPGALPYLARFAAEKADQLLIREAIMSGLENWELQFLQLLVTDPAWVEQRPGRSALLQTLTNAVIKEREPTKISLLLTTLAAQRPSETWRTHAMLDGIVAETQVRPVRPISFASAPAALDTLAKSGDETTRQQTERIKTIFSWPGHEIAGTVQPTAAPLAAGDEVLLAEGKNLFQLICSGCHALTGQGLKPLAPPLVNSEWVLGAESRLVRIALNGVSGPIKVNDTVYAPPNVLPEMPALGALEDRQIAAVLSYIRREWGHQAATISPDRVKAIRDETRGRQASWNEAQLLEIK